MVLRQLEDYRTMEILCRPPMRNENWRRSQPPLRQLKETGKTTKANTVAERRVRAASREATVKDVRKEVRKTLKDAGYLEKYAAKPAKKGTRKKPASENKKNKNTGKPTGSIHGLTAEQFSARVGLIIPKMKGIGLSDDQIEQVLALIEDLVTE